MNQIIELVKNEEWYQSLIEDCKDIITEAFFTSRWALVEGYHQLGERILGEYNNFEREKIYGEKILQRVAQSLGISKRTIYYAIQFAKKYPTLDKVPEGKNITWKKIITKYLPTSEENKIELPFPEGKYNIIYADPPWQYWEGGEKNQSRHYQTMTFESIKNLRPYNRPVKDLSADNCILFLWATRPILLDTKEIMEAWGFEYSTVGFVWVKSKQDGTGFAFGNGNWTRANAEYCLIGMKGSIERKNATISEIIYEPREEHSKKPDIVRDKIIQLVGNLPRIELFARQKVEGWESWGKEAQNGN